MKLKDCRYGLVVTDDEETKVGMIKGLTNNCPSQDRQERRKIENAIVLVEWSYGETYSIHPGNIKILK